MTDLLAAVIMKKMLQRYEDRQHVVHAFVKIMRDIDDSQGKETHEVVQRIQELLSDDPHLTVLILQLFQDTKRKTPVTSIVETPPSPAAADRPQEIKCHISFRGISTTVVLPRGSTTLQLKQAIIQNVALPVKDFELVRMIDEQIDIISDKSVFRPEQNARYLLREKKEYMSDLSRDMLTAMEARMVAFQNVKFKQNFYEILCKITDILSSNLMEETADRSIVSQTAELQELFKDSPTFFTQLIKFIPSLTFCHPSIRLHEHMEVCSQKEIEQPSQPIRKRQRSYEEAHLPQSKRRWSDSFPEEKRAKPAHQPLQSNEALIEKAMEMVFPLGLPFDENLLRLDQWRRFQHLIALYWLGGLQQKELMDQASSLFKHLQQADEKLEQALENVKGYYHTLGYGDYYSILQSDTLMKMLQTIPEQFTYRQLPEGLKVPASSVDVLNHNYVTRPSDGASIPYDMQSLVPPSTPDPISPTLPTQAEMENVAGTDEDSSESDPKARKQSVQDSSTAISYRTRSKGNVEDSGDWIDVSKASNSYMNGLYTADNYITLAQSVIQCMEDMKSDLKSFADGEGTVCVKDYLKKEDILLIRSMYESHTEFMISNHTTKRETAEKMANVVQESVRRTMNMWTNFKSSLEQEWINVMDTDVSKPDGMSVEYRNLFKQVLLPSHLWEELIDDGNALERLLTETPVKQNSSQRNVPETTYIVSSLSNCIVNEPGLLGWELNADSASWNWLVKAFDSMITNTAYNTPNLKHFWNSIIRDVFCIEECILQVPKERHPAPERNTVQLTSGQYTGHSTSVQTNADEISMLRDTREISYVEQMILGYKKDSKCLMFATEHFYVLFRHIMLFQARFQDLCVIAERSSNSNHKIHMIMKKLIETLNSETCSTKFTEKVTETFGSQAFRVRSFFKIVQSIVRTTNQLAADPLQKKLISLSQIHQKSVTKCENDIQFDDWMNKYQTLAWELVGTPKEDFICVQNDGRYFSMELLEIFFSEDDTASECADVQDIRAL